MNIVEKQRTYFSTGQTLPYAFRYQMLQKLRDAIVTFQDEAMEALQADLGKSQTEAILTEIWFTLNELKFTMKHLKQWMKPKKKQTTIFNQLGKSYIVPTPLGVTLILSPWNYPFQLTLCPLIGAIASGSTVVIKPSEYANATANVLEKIITSAFDPQYITIFQGGIDQAAVLLKMNFDHIFFTGSTKVGKIILEHASATLAKVTLELGGKSPCIVDQTANIKQAAKRIAFGKTVNSGQTCIAPDYILCHISIKNELIAALSEAFSKMYQNNYVNNPEYGRIVTEFHFNRIKNHIHPNKVLYGGVVNAMTQKIAPTILSADLNDPVMHEEIFGPILPVLTYESIIDIKHIISHNPNPLACYVFSHNKKWINHLLASISFGGGCINDVLSHVVGHHLPFGGVKESGHGAYHGYASFQAFSHMKSIYHKTDWFDIPIKYPPYSKQTKKRVRNFFLPRF